MQEKSRKCTFDFKIHAKKEQKCKKKAEKAFQLENSCKKGRKQKKESTFIWIFFAFISLVHFKPINSYKQRQKCKKKQKFFFKLQKFICKKKHEISFQKNMQIKSINAKKKLQKKAYGVYFYLLVKLLTKL